MDCCLSYNKSSLLQSLPSTVKTVQSSSRGRHRFLSSHKVPDTSCNSTFDFSGDRRFGLTISFSGRSNRRALIANDREYFHVAVAKQLVQLAAHRDEAVDRMNLSLASSEACLHRRIAELKENECQTSVEDVIYMLIFYKFSDIRVPLVPRLSRCIYNGRLEICPSRDWQLESIHTFEVLEMIREYLTTVVGWKANSNVTENWAITAVHRFHLCRVYAASILYGYFLKSASLRHHLDLSLSEINYDLVISSDTHLPLSELCSCGLKNVSFGCINGVQSTSVGQESCSRGKTREKLRCYVMGFDPETLQMCAKPKSKEACESD
ncbi:hypothetical protein F0562_021709 [Nyssa sinensis]|uniref:Uncharacterized protein n=1 Tax=Nyssa sinensis TaxID=561372 RepID=A0A5J5BK77_9ASTE|nr:hypothetical protein F0562_021709 [Nyssa sinensis]